MDFKAIAMGLAFALMWSSAFTSARMIVLDAPPLTSLAIRFLISGGLAIAIAAALGQSARLSRAQWRGVAVFGLCQNALYLGLNFIALQRVDASVAAIIASTMPLMVALSGWVFLGDRPRPLALAGLVAGLGGVILLMSARLEGGIDVGGVILCVLGVAALTAATLAVRSASSGGNLLMIVGLQMLVGSALLVLPALIREPFEVNWTWRLGGAFAYTVIVPGVIATLIWFALVGRIGAVKAATFHFLNPFFGVAIAAVLLGEALGLLDILGAAIIAAGILAVQVSRASGPRPPPVSEPVRPD